MKQFITNDEGKFHDLEVKAKEGCAIFNDQELPPGCSPDHARIGFEITPTGQAILYVEKGVKYDGPNVDIQNWLKTGLFTFPNFNTMKEWITGPLADEYSQTDIKDLEINLGTLQLVRSKEDLFRLSEKQTDLSNN